MDSASSFSRGLVQEGVERKNAKSGRSVKIKGNKIASH